MRYTEKQSMKYSPKWYVLSAVIFLMIAALLILLVTKMEELDTLGIIVLSAMPVIMIGVFVYLSSLELEIEIDDHGIKYKVPPMFSEWTHISKKEINSFEVDGGTVSANRKLHSKHKLRWIGKSKRFIVLGKHLLELKMTENRKLILSTLCPKKVEIVMKELMNEKQ